MYSEKFEKRVTQAAAYFLNKEGGSMFYLKLLKLLYLADRKALEEIGVPISFDDYYSLKHGPILSRTFNYIKSASVPPEGNYWKKFISEASNNKVFLINKFDLSSMSDAEIKVLKNTYDKFGHLNRWELAKYTHTLPEYEKPPQDSRLPIPRIRVLQKVYKDESEALIIEEQIKLHEMMQ